MSVAISAEISFVAWPGAPGCKIGDLLFAFPGRAKTVNRIKSENNFMLYIWISLKNLPC